MSENRSILISSAMASGLSMGIFWCVKYVFFILGLSSAVMNILYIILCLFVPVIALIQTGAYAYKIDSQKAPSFFHAWQFGVLLYFFAALIVSLVHYIFYQYIAPPGFLSSSMLQVADLLKSMDADPQMIEAINNTRITPIQMTIQGILNNTFYGVIFSLPVAWLVSRRKAPVKHTENDHTDETT